VVEVISVFIDLGQTPADTARPWIKSVCLFAQQLVLLLTASTQMDGYDELTCNKCPKAMLSMRPRCLAAWRLQGSWASTPCDAWWTGMMMPPPKNGCNTATFLVLFRVSEANRVIHADDPAACQLIWVASASAFIIPTSFMPDALLAATLPIYPGLRQALSYAGLHIILFGSTGHRKPQIDNTLTFGRHALLPRLEWPGWISREPSINVHMQIRWVWLQCTYRVNSFILN